MLSLLATLFSAHRHDSSPARRTTQRGRRMLAGLAAARSAGRSAERKMFAGSTEQLEARLAFAVDLQILEPDTAGSNDFPGRIYVTVDQGSDAYLQTAPVTHSGSAALTRDLLVAENGSFLNAQVVNEVDQADRYESLTVFSGTKREDIGVVAREWWLLDPEGVDSRQITGLQLYDGDDLYAHAMLDGLDQVPGWSSPVIFQPDNGLNEIYGSISYTQYDGTVSRWYFTNYNFTTQAFEIDKAFITAGPGVPTDGGLPNRTSLNEPLFRFEEPLLSGYNTPASLEFSPARGTGNSRYNKTLYINWSQTPTAPPIVTATFPKTRPVDPNTLVVDVLDYTNTRRGTVTGTLSAESLEFVLPGAHATGSDGTPPSLGIVTGTFAGEIFVQTPYNYDGVDEQFNQLGISTLLSRTDSIGNTQDGVVDIDSVNFAAEEGPADEPRSIAAVNGTREYEELARIASRRQGIDQETNPLSQGVSPGLNNRRVSDVEATFEIGQRIANVRLEMVAAAGVRAFRSAGVNVSAGAGPTLNASYLTFTRDQPATVTFAAGGDINQEVIVELAAPGSSVFVNSPITTQGAGGDIDLRATNVEINAPVTVQDRFDIGRTSSLNAQPRLTIDTPGGNDDGFFDTPTLAPERWTVQGREANPIPVLGPGGRVQSLIVPAGAEGYGYDPSSPPAIEITPPTPQQAGLEVLSVSGGLSDNILIGSRGVSIPDGVTEVRIPAGEDDYQFSFVRKITSGGVYDFTNAAGEINTAAVPIVVVAEPDILRNDTRIGYGRAAKAVAEWSTGIDYVQVTDGGLYTQTQGETGLTPPGAFSPTITIGAPTEGTIRFRPTVPIPNTKQIVQTTTAGNTTTIKSKIQTGLYPTAIVGAGYDKDNPPSVTAPYGIQAFVPSDAFRENILSLRVTDGGENYEGSPPVVDLVTKFDASGVAAVAYSPEATSVLAPGSVFVGPEIQVGFVTSQTSTYADRNLFEYLQIGMPIVGAGIRLGATVQGVDYGRGIVSLSPNGIEAPALLSAASIYPHEWYVDPANQPDPSKIENLVLIPTLDTDDAIVRIEGLDGELLSASWVDPRISTPYVVDVAAGTAAVEAAFDSFSGEFPGVTAGAGYTAVPTAEVADVLGIALTTRSISIGGSFFVTPPALNFELDGSIAEVGVVVPGSNYLSDQPNRTGQIELLVFGPGEGNQAEVQFDVSDGRFTGGGQVLNPGKGYLGAGSEQAAIEQVAPDEFAEGVGARAVFQAVVDSRGVVKEFIQVSGGEEYVTTPGVFVESPPALQAATAAGQVNRIEGTVTAVSVVTAGTGYRVPPVVVIDPPGPEGVGRRARAVAVIENGSVVRIEVVDGGQGYTAEPVIRLADPETAAVVENLLVNANVNANIYEVYVGNEVTTVDQPRGLLRVAPEVAMRNGVVNEDPVNSRALYLEAYGADVQIAGRIFADEQQYLLQSDVGSVYDGPFNAQIAATGTSLAAILGNESEPGISSAYRHTVSLNTDVRQLRVAAANIGYGDQTPFPYDLTVYNEGDLNIDSVLSAGGDVNIKVNEGNLNIGSAIRTAAGLTIKSNAFTVASPLESINGPIILEATGGIRRFEQDFPIKDANGQVTGTETKIITEKTFGNLKILNDLTVTRTGLQASREDIRLSAGGGKLDDESGLVVGGNVVLAGDVNAINTVSIQAERGNVNFGTAEEPIYGGSVVPPDPNNPPVSIISGDSLLIISDSQFGGGGASSSEVKIGTDVRKLLIEVEVGATVWVKEENDVEIDIRADTVEVQANGVDGPGDSAKALRGGLRDTEKAVLSAPYGSIDVRNDAAGRVELGEVTEVDSDGNKFKSEAAGDVVYRTDAIAVEVVDAAVAGAAARAVRIATTSSLAADVSYDSGITGLVSATLEGDGSIAQLSALVQDGTGFNGSSLKVGDKVLVKNEFGEIAGRRNGVYEIVRLGGGASGYSRWRLMREQNSDTQAGLPSGSFVRVLEGVSKDSLYQIEYVQRAQRLVDLSREGQITIPDTAGASALDGIDIGTTVTGSAIISGATVQGIDWLNRVVTLGIIDGQNVRYFESETVETLVNSNLFASGESLGRVKRGAEYVGLQLVDTAGQEVSADSHPLMQAVRQSLAAGKTPRITGSGLRFNAEIAWAEKGILLIEQSYVNSDGSWAEAVFGSTQAPQQVRVGFTETANNGRTLNPAARAQLLTVPIQRVSGNTITIGEGFYRWDAIEVGQSLFGDGLNNTAVVQTVDVASRTVTVTPGSIAAALPSTLEIETVASGINENPAEFDRIYLDGVEVSETDFAVLQYGDVLRVGGVRAFTTVLGMDVRERAIFVAAGSIEAFGGPGQLSVASLQVLNGKTLLPRLDGRALPVVSVSAFSAEANSGDFVQLQSRQDQSTGGVSEFDDRSFEHLWIGMEVRGENIRPGSVVTRIDPVTRIVGLSRGTIMGPVTEISFLAPAYDFDSFDRAAATLELTQQGLVDAGEVPEEIRASVVSWSSLPVGRLESEIYRVFPSSAGFPIGELNQQSRTRFIAEPQAVAGGQTQSNWGDNVFVGQDVATDLVEFSSEDLFLQDTNKTRFDGSEYTESEKAILAATTLASTNQEDGSRVYAIVEVEEKDDGVQETETFHRLVRWDYVTSQNPGLALERKTEQDLFDGMNSGDNGRSFIEVISVDQDEFLLVAADKSLQLFKDVRKETGPVPVDNAIHFDKSIDRVLYDEEKNRLLVSSGSSFSSSASVKIYSVSATGVLSEVHERSIGAVDLVWHYNADGSRSGKVWALLKDRLDLYTDSSLANRETSRDLQASDEVAYKDKAVDAIVSPSDGRVFVASDSTAGKVLLELIKLDEGDPQANPYVYDGVVEDLWVAEDRSSDIYVAAGDRGLVVLSLADDGSVGADKATALKKNVSYSISEKVIGFGLSNGPGDAGTGYEPQLITAGGRLLSWRRLSVTEEKLPRSAVQGVDYATGVISITDTGFGIGRDQKIVTVGEYQYALAPSADLHFLTETNFDNVLPRLDDRSTSLDDGNVVELHTGKFADGYIVAGSIFGRNESRYGKSGIEPWWILKTLLDDGSPAPEFYIQNKFGDWVYGGTLTGVDSFSGAVGLRGVQSADSDSPDVSVQRLLREISEGTEQLRILVDPTPVNDSRSTNARVLEDASFTGDEIEIVARGQRPYDSAPAFGGMFKADEGGAWDTSAGVATEQYPVAITEEFSGFNTIVPGMRVFGEGLPSAGRQVTAVDIQNRLVWLDGPRELTGVRSAPNDSRVWFSYTMNRGGNYDLSRFDGALDEGVSGVRNSFAGGVMLADVVELREASEISSGSGLGDVVAGMRIEPLVPDSLPVTGTGGIVTGVDYKTGVVGVSFGSIVSANLGVVRFAADTESDIQRYDRNDNGWIDDSERLRIAAPKTVVSVQFSAARASAAGGSGETVVLLSDSDAGGRFSDWSSLNIGGAVYLELPGNVAGEREVQYVGTVLGFDPTLGAVSVKTSDAAGMGFRAFYEAVNKVDSSRLLFADPPDNDQAPPTYQATDPSYENQDYVNAVSTIENVQRDYSNDQTVSRVGVSGLDDRAAYSTSTVMVSGEDHVRVSPYGVETDEHGVFRTDPAIVLGDTVGISERQDLAGGLLAVNGDGITIQGSLVNAMRATAHGWLLNTNGGVVAPGGEWVSRTGQSGESLFASADTDLYWTVDTAVDRLSASFHGSYGGDLVKVNAGDLWQPLLLALQADPPQEITVTIGQSREDSTRGSGLKRHQAVPQPEGAKVIGVDPINQIVVLEAGSIVHTDLIDLRFFIDGKRIAAGEGSLETLSVESEGFYPDVAVLGTVRSRNTGDFTPVGSGQEPGALLLRLETTATIGGEFGTQPRFNRYSEIEVGTNVEIYDTVQGLTTPLGTVRGVDATNALISLEVASGVEEAEALLNSNRVIRFASVGSVVGADEVNDLAVVESYSSAADTVGVLGADGDRISRLTVDPLFENWAGINLDDLAVGIGIAPHVANADGSLSGPRVVGFDKGTRTVAIEYVGAAAADADRSAVLNEKQIASLQFYAATRPDPLEQPSVHIGITAAVGFIDGAFTNGGDSEYSIISMEIPDASRLGYRIEADPLKGQLGKFGEIRGWASGLGIAAVTPGVVINSAPGELVLFSMETPVQAWSEPQGTSASNWNTEGHTFDQARISVAPEEINGAESGASFERIRLGSPVYRDGGSGDGPLAVGFVTGFDRDLGLLGIDPSESQAVIEGDTLQVPIAELAEMSGIGLMNTSRGVFEGARFVFPAQQLTTTSGVPFDVTSLAIGMPVWDENYNIIANITGVATFEGAGDDSVVLLGLTANTSNGLSNADIAAGGPAEIGRNEVVYFGGYRVDGEPQDVVGKLSRHSYSAGIIATSTLELDPPPPVNGVTPGPSATDPHVVTGSSRIGEIYEGFNVARVTLVPGFGLNDASLLGAKVSGPGIAPDTIVTAYDRGLDLIGLSKAPIGLSAGAVIDVTPVDVANPVAVQAVVASSSVSRVGNLNGSLGSIGNNWNNEKSVLRVHLSDEVILPADLNEWIGAEVGQAVGGDLGGENTPWLQVQIVGIDADSRLLALRTVRVGGDEPNPGNPGYEPVLTQITSPGGLSSVVPEAWLSLGHSNSRRDGSSFSLQSHTSIFVAASSLTVERLDGPAREVPVTATGAAELTLNNQAADDLAWLRAGMIVAGNSEFQSLNLPAGTQVAEVNQTTDANTGTVTTTVTLAHPDPFVSVNVNNFEGTVLFMTKVTDEVVVGDQLLVHSDSASGQYRITGIDPLLGLVTVADNQAAMDETSLRWLLSQGGMRSLEIIASAKAVTSSSVVGPGGNGLQHTFDQARIVVDDLNDPGSPATPALQWDKLFVGQVVSGEGLNESSSVVITGIDEQLGLIGLGVVGGGISGVSGRFSDRVIVDGASLAGIAFEKSGVNATAASVSPLWNAIGELAEGHVLVRLENGFVGIGWLGEAIDKGESLRITAESIKPQSPSNLPQTIFEIDHTAENEVLKGLDPQLGLLQLNLSSLDQVDEDIWALSKVSTLKIQKLDSANQPLAGSDDVTRVVIQSFSVDDTRFSGDAVAAHGLDAEQLVLDLNFTQYNALIAEVAPRYIRGSGVRPGAIVTRTIYENGQAKLIVPAGTIASREQLFADSGVVILDEDLVSGNGNERYVVVTATASGLVGTITEDRIGLPATFDSYTSLQVGARVVDLLGADETTGVFSPEARVTGYDAANRILGISEGGVVAPLGTSKIRIGGTAELLKARTISTGDLKGDRITLSAPIDLTRVKVGDRIRGDGLAFSSRVIGIISDQQQLVLSVGAVEQADRVQEVFIGTDPVGILVKTAETVISAGSTSGVVIRITEGFTQYDRLFIGMGVAGVDGPGTGGLSVVAKISGIDEKNRLLFLEDSAVNAIGLLEQLVFRDADGQFSADVEKDSTQRPKASYGVNSPESSIRGTLNGDLLTVVNLTARTFDDIRLGLPVQIDGVASEARVIGFEPRTGVIALPYGTLQTSVPKDGAEPRLIPVRSGFDTESVAVNAQDSSTAALTFQQDDIAILAGVTIGQIVVGNGIRGTAVVRGTNLVLRRITIESTDGKAVLVNSDQNSPLTNVQFLAPTEFVLGAVKRTGTETIQFEVDEFGVAPITVRNPVQSQLTGIRPVSEMDRGGVSDLRLRTSIGLQAISQVNELVENQQITGTVIRPGFRYLAPRLTSNAEGIQADAQFYTGVLEPKKLSGQWNIHLGAADEEISITAIYGTGFNQADIEEIDVAALSDWPLVSNDREDGTFYKIPASDVLSGYSTEFRSRQFSEYRAHLETLLGRSGEDTVTGYEIVKEANDVRYWKAVHNPVLPNREAFNADRAYLHIDSWDGSEPDLNSDIIKLSSHTADGFNVEAGQQNLGVAEGPDLGVAAGPGRRLVLGYPANAISSLEKTVGAADGVFTFVDDEGVEYRALGSVEYISRTPEAWQDGFDEGRKDLQRQALANSVLGLRLRDPGVNSEDDLGGEYPDYQTLTANGSDNAKVVRIESQQANPQDLGQIGVVSPQSKAVWMQFPEGLSLGGVVNTAEWTVSIGGLFQESFLAQPSGVATATVSRTSAAATTEIGTENPLGSTIFLVSNYGQTNNDSPSSLGKMIRVWQSARQSKTIADANPEVTFRFKNDSSDNEIKLLQELPAIKEPMLIDGSVNEIGQPRSSQSRVAIDGSLITKTANGEAIPASQKVHGFYFDGVDIYNAEDQGLQPPLPGSRPIVGLKGLTLSGFSGAAVVLDGTKGGLVEDVTTGIDADFQQSANGKGVWVTGGGSWNSIRESRILTSEVGIQIDANAKFNTIASTVVGDAFGNNDIGVLVTGERNWVGARGDLQSDSLAGSGTLHVSATGLLSESRAFVFSNDQSAKLQDVRPGMAVAFSQYPMLRLQVTGVEPSANTIEVSTEPGVLDEYADGNASLATSVLEKAVARTVQRLDATVGYPASGAFNSGVLVLSSATWQLVEGGVYVGQSVSGNGIPAGTVITHIRSDQTDQTAKEITLSNVLTDSGYRGPKKDNRLVLFGVESSKTVLTNNKVGIQVGLGSNYVNGVNGSDVIYFPDGFIGLASVKPGMTATFSGKTDFVSLGNEYFVKSINPDQGIIVLEEPLKLESGRVLLSTSNDVQRSVVFREPQSQVKSVVISNVEVRDSFDRGIEVLDGQDHQLGGVAEFRDVSTGPVFGGKEFTSWGIEAAVVQGQTKLTISETAAVTLLQFAIDLSGKEREEFLEENPTIDQYGERLKDARAYGGGLVQGTKVVSYQREDGVLKLTLDEPVEIAGIAQISFGVGWYQDLETAGVRIGDRVVSEVVDGKFIPGRDIPQFTEVRGIGTNYIKLSTPSAGLRLEDVTGREGTEGFNAKEPGQVNPSRVAFVNVNGVGSSVVGSNKVGVWATAAALEVMENQPTGLTIIGNSFGLERDGTGELQYRRNRLGAIDPELFSQLYGGQVPEDATNRWDKSDRFANLFEIPDYAFEVFLDADSDDTDDRRPVYWYQ